MLSTDQLNNLIKQQVIAVLSTFSLPRIGIVVGYDKNTYTAKVQIQPDGIVTNYLPIRTNQSGNGWGDYSGLNNGDMVLVEFQEGDLSTGIIIGNIFNSVDMPISPAPANGERWFVHKTGTFLKLLNDGTIDITTLDVNGNPTNVNIIGNVVVTGNITATGDILDTSGTNTDTVKGMRTIYNSHTHGGIFVGDGNTLDPNQPM